MVFVIKIMVAIAEEVTHIRSTIFSARLVRLNITGSPEAASVAKMVISAACVMLLLVVGIAGSGKNS